MDKSQEVIPQHSGFGCGPAALEPSVEGSLRFFTAELKIYSTCTAGLFSMPA
jgi:hypothetical protein